jgi:hypothetical protein
VSEWVGRYMSDKELDDGMAEVERLRDRLRELMDRFEAMKLAALRGGPDAEGGLPKQRGGCAEDA